MAKLRILRKTQHEEQQAKEEEEKRKRKEMETAKLLSDLKSSASRRATEDSEEQLLQTRMQKSIEEMNNATKNEDSDLLKAITKVLGCYQSK